MNRLFLVIFCLSLEPSARAYIQNRSLFPMGEREASMANTGTALSASSGAVYYNPAGLANITQKRFSISGNSYFSYKKDYTPLAEADSEDLNFSSTSLQTIPSTLVSIIPLESSVLAFSILIPEQIRSSDLHNFETSRYNIQISNQAHSDLILLGFSKAQHFDNTLDYGYGCFWTQYSATQSTSVIAAPKPGSGLTINGISTTYAHSQVNGIICNAGFLKMVSEKFSWGFNFFTPLYRISGEGQISSFVQNASGTTNTGVQKQSSNYDIPPELSFGIALNQFTNVQIFLDINFQSSVRYRPFENISSEIKSNEILRYHLGTAWTLNSRNTLLGGYSYNPSSINLTNIGDEKEDFHIFSFGYEVKSETTAHSISVFRGQSEGLSKLSETRNGKIASQLLGIYVSARFGF